MRCLEALIAAVHVGNFLVAVSYTCVRFGFKSIGQVHHVSYIKLVQYNYASCGTDAVLLFTTTKGEKTRENSN